jgi:hypothetical protein
MIAPVTFESDSNFMTTMLNRLFILTAVTLMCNTLIAGGGWVKKKGEGYYKVGQSWVQSMGYFSGGLDYSPKLNSELFTTSFYSEHGLSDRFSAELYLPIFINHITDGTVMDGGMDIIERDNAGGIGDINLGLRGSIYSSDLINVGGTFTLGLPTGKPGLGKRENLFTGDGEFNQIIRVDASVPFGGKKVAGYSTVYSGFNNRSNNFSDEYHYGVEVGLSAMESRLWLIGRINGINAIDASLETEFTNSFTQSMSFTNYMVEAAFYFDQKTGLSVSYTGSLDGNVLLVAPVYSIGIFLDVK